MILDPTDVVTALLYVYWAHEFQSAVNQAYTMVRSSALKSVDGVVEFWAKIPNTSDQFQSFLQGQLHIQCLPGDETGGATRGLWRRSC